MNEQSSNNEPFDEAAALEAARRAVDEAFTPEMKMHAATPQSPVSQRDPGQIVPGRPDTMRSL